jgi:hypothetical protein
LDDDKVRVMRLCGIADPDITSQWKYYFRAVNLARIPKFVRNFIEDGAEMQFGMGVDGAAIDLPDPGICNLHLAVARVIAASGFAEMVEIFTRIR